MSPPTARSPPREDCVICFDTLDTLASANPCLHASYHSHCLLQWLELNPSCPLCKTPVTHVTTPNKHTIYTVQRKPPPVDPLSLWGRPANHTHTHTHTLPPRRRRPVRRPPPPPTPTPLESFPPYRLDVYRHSRFSLHIGSNPHSGYRPLTPTTLHDPTHLSRARSFIRRELLVLDALDPSLPRPDLPRDTASPQRSRAFRLEYIVAVLKAAGVHGSSGAGEELLGRYLGRYTRLFLHELRSFLRSPFGRVEEWDRGMGYGPSVVSR